MGLLSGSLALLGDAGGSVAVIVSTVAVAVFDAPVADPVAALLILWSAGRVLSERSSILLQRSPVDLSAVRAGLAGRDDVVPGRRRPRLAGV